MGRERSTDYTKHHKHRRTDAKLHQNDSEHSYAFNSSLIYKGGIERRVISRNLKLGGIVYRQKCLGGVSMSETQIYIFLN